MVKKFDEFVNENVYDDMIKRSQNKTVRSEDDIDNLDKDEMLQYLKNRYTWDEDYGIGIYSSRKKDADGQQYFAFPLFIHEGKMFRLVAQYNGKGSPNVFISAQYMDCEEFVNELNKKFYMTVDSQFGIRVRYKDGKSPNRLIVDIIDTIIKNTSEPLLKKI